LVIRCQVSGVRFQGCHSERSEESPETGWQRRGFRCQVSGVVIQSEAKNLLKQAGREEVSGVRCQGCHSERSEESPETGRQRIGVRCQVSGVVIQSEAKNLLKQVGRE
jgi:hypothetical protein